MSLPLVATRSERATTVAPPPGLSVGGHPKVTAMAVARMAVAVDESKDGMYIQVLPVKSPNAQRRTLRLQSCSGPSCCVLCFYH